MADRYKLTNVGPMAFGAAGGVVTPNNTTDFTSFAKAVVVTSIAGGSDLRILPVSNDDTGWITFVGVQVGYSPPYRVRRVHTDTNCVVATVLDEDVR